VDVSEARVRPANLTPRRIYVASERRLSDVITWHACGSLPFTPVSSRRRSNGTVCTTRSCSSVFNEQPLTPARSDETMELRNAQEQQARHRLTYVQVKRKQILKVFSRAVKGVDDTTARHAAAVVAEDSCTAQRGDASVHAHAGTSTTSCCSVPSISSGAARLCKNSGSGTASTSLNCSLKCSSCTSLLQKSVVTQRHGQRSNAASCEQRVRGHHQEGTHAFYPNPGRARLWPQPSRLSLPLLMHHKPQNRINSVCAD
jgi:hypothetical protein